MRHRHFQYDRRVGEQPRGLTLVEVLCATALAGSLLSGLLIAQSAHLKQIRTAQRQTTAVQLLDRMLDRWTATREGLPADGDHAVTEAREWICRIRRLDPPDAAVLLARVARVELWEALPEQRGATASASVEMLVPEDRERRR